MKRLTSEEFAISERTPAQDRLYRIVQTLIRCNPLDPTESRFLAESLMNILLGDDPKKALGISGRQAGGRPKKSYLEIDKSEVRPVVEAMELMRFDGLSWDAAIKKIAAKYRISLSTLKRHYAKHRKEATASVNLVAGGQKAGKRLAQAHKESEEFLARLRQQKAERRKAQRNAAKAKRAGLPVSSA